MSNLLKSAIADAKMIRQTALENAKAALQEAFTPKLQSMLSKKIAEETETAIDSEPAYTDGKKLENPSGANNRMNAPKVKEAYAVTDDQTGKPSINLSEDGDEIPGEEDPNAALGGDAAQVPAGEVELDVDATGAPVDIVPVGGGDVHLDPSATAGAGEENLGGEELPGDDQQGASADALELESIIKELEDEANAGEELPEPSFGDDAGGEEDGKEVNVAVGQAPEDVHVNFQDEPESDGATAEVPGADDGEQEINLEEILRELEEESDEKEKVDETLTTDQTLKAHTEQPQKGNFGSDKTGTNGTPSKGGTEPAIEKAEGDSKYGKVNGSAGENIEDFGKKTPSVNENKLRVELGEYKKAVEYLRGKINEVNLLNAKLLYTNKLFRNFPLSNEQKVKVVESLDLTKNVREVKLVYTTLAESFSFGVNSPKKTLSSSKRTITEGLASKPIASTKPSEKTILTEGMVMANRFQKLAGIKAKK